MRDSKAAPACATAFGAALAEQIASRFTPRTRLVIPDEHLTTATMRYVMRQKLFAFGDDFHIKDESGRDVYIVDGKMFSIGDKLSFRDMSGHELVYIREKLISIGHTYELYRNGELAGVVKKKMFTLFRCKFSVDVPGPDDLEAQGNFFDYEYRFERGGRQVAEVSKRWFSFTDTYAIDVAQGEDDVLILASAVVIDLICHGDRKEH